MVNLHKQLPCFCSSLRPINQQSALLRVQPKFDNTLHASLGSPSHIKTGVRKTLIYLITLRDVGFLSRVTLSEGQRGLNSVSFFFFFFNKMEALLLEAGERWIRENGGADRFQKYAVE